MGCGSSPAVAAFAASAAGPVAWAVCAAVRPLRSRVRPSVQLGIDEHGQAHDRGAEVLSDVGAFEQLGS